MKDAKNFKGLDKGFVKCSNSYAYSAADMLKSLAADAMPK